MNEIMTTLGNWGPAFVLLGLAVLGIVLSLAGSLSLEEKRLNGQDDDHYVLRQPLSRIVRPLILLAIGAAIQAALFFARRFVEKPAWLMPVIAVVLAAVFGMLFWLELAKVIRQRVFVNGDKIRVTPAFGAAVETTFSQIRTVANKVVGGDGGVVGKKIKTKEGTKFEVINCMEGYEHFCEQLDAKVELPNLTKKLFKKKAKDDVEKTWEETVSDAPLPAPSVTVAADASLEGTAAEIPADSTLPNTPEPTLTLETDPLAQAAAYESPEGIPAGTQQVEAVFGEITPVENNAPEAPKE